MKEDDVTQIVVAGQRTGIIGLHAALEEVDAACCDRSDTEIKAALVERLGRRNYMTEKARDAYAAAFLREYKKFTGQPVEEDRSGPVQVKVLGPGCPNCERLEQEVMQVMGERGFVAELEHVRDAAEIAAYGIVTVPGLVVDGEVLASGRLPGKENIAEWLQEATDKRNPK